MRAPIRVVFRSSGLVRRSGMEQWEDESPLCRYILYSHFLLHAQNNPERKEKKKKTRHTPLYLCTCYSTTYSEKRCQPWRSPSNTGTLSSYFGCCGGLNSLSKTAGRYYIFSAQTMKAKTYRISFRPLIQDSTLQQWLEKNKAWIKSELKGFEGPMQKGNVTNVCHRVLQVDFLFVFI